MIPGGSLNRLGSLFLSLSRLRRRSSADRNNANNHSVSSSMNNLSVSQSTSRNPFETFTFYRSGAGNLIPSCRSISFHLPREWNWFYADFHFFFDYIKGKWLIEQMAFCLLCLAGTLMPGSLPCNYLCHFLKDKFLKTAEPRAFNSWSHLFRVFAMNQLLMFN